MGFLRIFSRKKYKDDSNPSAPALAMGRSGGTWINEDSAMQVAAFHRGVLYISTQIAKLPWEIKDRDNNIIEDSIYDLLRYSPNPEMNTFFFRLMMTYRALVHGNAYAEIERDMLGRPIALWPINVGDCEPVRDTTGKLWYRINSTSTTDGKEALMSPSDIFAIRNVHTKDGIVGQGLLAYALEILGIAKGADIFANSLYANGAMPSGVITVPGSLSDEAFARLKDSWDKKHSGRKTGGTAILEEGSEYKVLSMPPDILQFLETRKFSVLDIARFLGVPPQKLFDSDSATYNNIEHANLEVVTDTLDVWAKNYEIETDVKMLKGNRHTKANKCEMDLRAIFRGDMNTRSNYFTRRMQTASMTPNQIRLMEGDAPYVGGDEYYIAANNYSPVGRLDEIIDSQIEGKTKDTKEKTEDKELNKAAVAFLSKS